MSSRGEVVVKRLFPPTPEKAATKRTPLHYTFWRSRNRRSSFRTGILGALIFLVLCVSVVVVTAKLNNGWTQLTLDGMYLHCTQRVCFDYIVCFVSIFTTVYPFRHINTVPNTIYVCMCVLDMVLGKVSKIII